MIPFMPVSEEDFLSLLGWNDFFKNQISDSEEHQFTPGRVISEERNLYRIQTGLNKYLWAAVSGKLSFKALTRIDYPAVGDWVLVEMPANSERGIIHQTLQRKTSLNRKQVGEGSDIQILSTNVDTVFVTTSLNEDLNMRRLERYLTLVGESGARPVILLTKTDIYGDSLESLMKEIETNFPGVLVHCLRHDKFDNADFLADLLQPGTTSVFIGSSGVGKSTIINYLKNSDDGGEVIKTQDIRATVWKGRHTTTSRNLYFSRFGGLVIDTPGMRELQLSDHGEGMRTQFADVEALMQSCRFSNCRHGTEPGCGILQALKDKILTQERWDGYRKLDAEILLEKVRLEKAQAIQEKRSMKKSKNPKPGKKAT